MNDYNTRQVAHALDVSVITVNDWANKNKIPCYRVGKGRGARYYPAGQLEKWAAELREWADAKAAA